MQEIAERSMPYPWSLSVFEDCYRAGYLGWVLCVEESVRGFAFLSVLPDEAELLTIAIDPGVQRCGLGRRLLTHVLEEAKQQGLLRVFLEVRASNHRAITLYTDMGFQSIGLRKNYYPVAAGGREDALLFYSPLVSSVTG